MRCKTIRDAESDSEVRIYSAVLFQEVMFGTVASVYHERDRTRGTQSQDRPARVVTCHVPRQGQAAGRHFQPVGQLLSPSSAAA